MLDISPLILSEVVDPEGRCLFLWRNYAMTPNVALTECAQRLKQALLYAIEDGTIDTTEQQRDAQEKRNGTHGRT